MVKQVLKWTSVKRTEIELSNFRLEANAFNVDARAAFVVLNQCKFPIVPLCGHNGLATAHHFGRFKRVFVDKSNLPIYQPSQILEIAPKAEKFISDKTDTDVEALRVKANQILLTRSGTIGKCAFVSQTLADKIFSDDLIRIEARQETDAGYIYAYLASKTGQTVLTTNNYGAVIQHIEPNHLDNVLIPDASAALKQAIHQKVVRSFALRDESNALLQQAETLLLNALQLPPFEQLKPDYYRKHYRLRVFSVSRANLNDRLEASYHIPAVKKILNVLENNGIKVLPLGDKTLTQLIFLPLRFKRIYVEENYGHVFFGGKQLQELNPSGKKYLSSTLHDNKTTSELLLHENMILVTRSGTVGKVNIVAEHWENWIANDHILRITPKSKNEAGYIYVWLNSEFGKTFINRFIYGSVVNEIEVEHLSEIPIPMLKDESQIKTINDLALQANALRSEAYYLEQAALQQMNEEVIYASR